VQFVLARHTLPGLTTIDVHRYELGTRTADAMLALLSGKPNPHATLIDLSLVVRGSTGLPRAGPCPTTASESSVDAVPQHTHHHGRSADRHEVWCAGNLSHFSGSLNVMKLQAYAKQLYRELPVKHGDIGLHVTGALRLAHTTDRMDEFHRVSVMARLCGIDLPVVTPARMRELPPFFQTEGLSGGLGDTIDGHVDPTR
jgi:hypothetical protein